MKLNKHRGRLNVIWMGVCFSLLFTSFFSISNLAKIFLVSVRDEVPGYTADGYFSEATIYLATAIFLWFSPAICNVVGSKLSMFFGAMCFTCFICSFFFTITWVLYVASAVIGVGYAILWVGQSAYLVLNSDQTTLETNLGLFFALYQSGGLLGNIFVYIQFSGKHYIDADTRHLVILFMAIVVAVGGLLILFLPSYKKGDLLEMGNKDSCKSAADTELAKQQADDAALIQNHESPLQSFKKGLKIALSTEVLLLQVLFANIGFSYTFTVVYNTSLGFTRTIPNSLQMVPVAGLVSGMGGMISGVLPVFIKPELSLPFNLRPLLLIGFVCYVCSYVIAFLNFPANAIFGYTDDKAYIESTAYLAIIGSCLLRLAEMLYYNETAVLLAKLFPNDTVSAFAVYMFFTDCAAAVTFVGSNYGNLHTQISCLAIVLVLGTFSFWYVTKRLRTRQLETGIAAVTLK